MSLFIKARCGNCNGVFELYHKTMQRESPVCCPHCRTRMTEKQWNGLVNCYHTMQDWNSQSIKSHEEHGTPGFVAEIRRHYVPCEKYNYN